MCVCVVCKWWCGFLPCWTCALAWSNVFVFVSANGGCTVDSHTLDSHTLDSHTVDSHTVDSHTVDSHTVDSYTADSHTIDSHTVDSHTVDSHIITAHCGSQQRDHLCEHTHTRAHTHSHTHTLTQTHTNTHTNTHNYTHTHTHTLSNTHTNAQALQTLWEPSRHTYALNSVATPLARPTTQTTLKPSAFPVVGVPARGASKGGGDGELCMHTPAHTHTHTHTQTLAYTKN